MLISNHDNNSMNSHHHHHHHLGKINSSGVTTRDDLIEHLWALGIDGGSLTCCVGLFFVLGCWLGGLGVASWLLYRNHTSAVFESCHGYWEFTLFSLLSPVLLPLCYVIFACGGNVTWGDFYGVSLASLTAASFAWTAVVTSSSACVQAMSDSTPSEPWLLILGWVKSCIYFATLCSVIRRSSCGSGSGSSSGSSSCCFK